MADITYCINTYCPFKDCERHLCKAEKAYEQGQRYISVASFDGVCRRYISLLVDEVAKEQGDG